MDRKDYSKEATYDYFMGKYVSIEVSGKTARAGKLIDIIKGHAILNPYIATDWVSGEEPAKAFIPLKASIDLSNPGTIVEEKTEQGIRNYCIYQNNLEAEERRKKSKENQSTK